MAKSRLKRYLSIVWDRDAGRRLEQEAEASLDRAGKLGADALEDELKKGGQKGARALTSALQREYKLRMARAQQQLAEGAIDEKRFRKEGEKAAAEFNKGLSAGINKLRTSTGGLTDAQFAGLAGRYKRTGSGPGGIAAGAMLGRFAGPLAGVFTAGAALNEAREMVSASDQLEASVRKLGGTARITGLDFGTLSAAAAQAKEELRVAVPIANDLTGMMTRLAARAGDASQANRALVGWMDLAGASGLTAAEALQALEVTFRGQDEGLNRLGLANPAEIYKKWGAGADEASKAQAILKEVLDASTRVQGEWARAMETGAGQAEQAAGKVQELRAEMGDSLQPAREMANELRVGLYEVLADIAGVAGRAAGRIQEVIQERQRLHGLSPSAGMNLLDRMFGGAIPPAETGAGGTWELEGLARMRAEGDAIRQAQAAASAAERIARPLAPLPTDQERKAAESRTLALWKHLNEWAKTQPEHAQFRLLAGEHGLSGDLKAGGDALQRQRDAFRERGGTLDPVTNKLAGEGGVIQPRELTAFEETVREVMLNSAGYAQEAAYQMSTAFQDAFQLMMDEGMTLGNFMEGLGRGMAGSILAGVAQIAQVKSAEMFVRAIEAGATALLTKDPAAAASVPKWLAAGTGYAALAGLASAGRAGVTGGGGAFPVSTRDAGLSTARDAERMGPEVHIYIDPLDPHNPAYQRNVYAARQFAGERFGENATVTVHPRGGR